MKPSKLQDDKHGFDDSFDINIQETVDFQIDTSDDDYVGSRYERRGNFSYWKFFIGLFCVALAVFAVIKIYDRYEQKKEMEATIKALETLGLEMDKEMRRILQ